MSLAPGDLIVHFDHGIGRFEGLETIVAAGTIHNVHLTRLWTQDEIVKVRQKAAELRGSYKAPGG